MTTPSRKMGNMLETDAELAEFMSRQLASEAIGPLSRLWGEMREPIHIVVGAIEDHAEVGGPAMGSGEWFGSYTLPYILSFFYNPAKIHLSLSTEEIDVENSSVVLLGGPIANVKSKDAFTLLRKNNITSLEFQRHDLFYDNNLLGRADDSHDIGCCLLGDNPFSPKRSGYKMVMACGSKTLGTFACVSALTDPSSVRALVRHNCPSEFVVATERFLAGSPEAKVRFILPDIMKDVEFSNPRPTRKVFQLGLISQQLAPRIPPGRSFVEDSLIGLGGTLAGAGASLFVFGLHTLGVLLLLFGLAIFIPSVASLLLLEKQQKFMKRITNAALLALRKK